MGLDAETIGSTAIQRIVRLRMKAAGVKSIDDYNHLLSASAAEWNHLVEAVVITETWFFRDPQAFQALMNMIRTEHPPGRTARIRILSLPCSSGEEPYSIAMSLLDAGVSANRFAIDGVDLSRRALDKAVAGLYGKNSFRGSDLAFRARHFTTEEGGFAIKQSIRDCVSFQQTNLLNDTFAPAHLRYDFIFCRNLLIYFDRATQRRAFAKLESLLARGGTLFVGPAEVPLAMENGFSSVNLPMAFACRRSAEVAAVTHTAQPSAPTPLKKPAPVAPPAVAPPLPKPLAKAAVAAKADADALAMARQLADGGKFEEATRLCQAHLDKHGANVQAYFLLGVIHDALGHPAAQEFYRKALYLDPNHYDSLLQMALLAEKNGDDASARNLRRRAQRLQNQS